MRTADTSTQYNDTVAAFRGCDAVIHLAAIPDPVGKPDGQVHQNNVASAFNGFRACGELGIKRICYASSVNAIGLVYASQPLHFPYFPIDEDYPLSPTDAYALAKVEAETQARSFVNWFPGTKIACLRIHEVAQRMDVAKEHSEDWDGAGVKQLWGWVSPTATARACLLAVKRSHEFDGCQIFNITARDTAQEERSRALARKHYPRTEVRGDLEVNASFWTTKKAQDVLGWIHHGRA
jgi:nucleoside-diphosphate-sugar epimerase